MLQFILAASGGGKTTHIMNLIKDYSRNPECRMTLIIPEQYSFTCEKNVLQLIGAEKKKNIDVISFTQLAEKLIGKPAFYERRRLSESTAAVLMKMALENVADNLVLYRKSVGRKSAIKEFLALSSEFKQNSVSVDHIRKASVEMKEGLLRTKLSDIAVILEEFNKLTGEKHFNPDDLLTELAGISALDGYFADRIVFLDSFRGFTAQEYEILRHILINSKAVYVTLCAKDFSNSDDITDLFAKTKNTASRITAIANENGVRIMKPQFLSGKSKYNNFPPHFDRYKSNELRFLESELFGNNGRIYEDNCDNITLYKAENIYDECNFIAATAKKLIREKGYRCRDIAVIARHMESYESPLRTALGKYGIDVFEDSRRPVETSPVINAVLAATAIAAKGFDTESIMRFLKTRLTDLSTEETSKLENYCFLWNINGKKWLTEWTASPEGFDGEKETDSGILEEINRLRETVINPVSGFRNTLFRGTDGETAVKALWKFIEETHLSSNLKKLAEKLHAKGEDGMVIELERMWQLLVDTLDELLELVKGRKITAGELSDTLELMLSVKTIGTLPQGLDEIIIGSADRIRTGSPEVTFIAGANDGVFPAVPASSSTLTPRDRALMEDYGISLSGTSEWKLAEEKLIAYTAFCSPSEKLFVSCTERGAMGDSLNPGEYYLKIRSMFTLCEEKSRITLDEMYFTEGKQPAFEQLALSQPGVFRSTAETYFESTDDYRGKLSALRHASGNRDFRISDTSVATGLFGRNMHISASRVESFYKCAFSYFCRYGIKANPRKTAELDSPTKGTIIHYVLETLLSTYSRDELTAMEPSQVRDYVSDLMNKYLEDVLDGAQRDGRFLYLYTRLRYTVGDIALRIIEEFSHTEFVPVDFELEIDHGAEIEPYSLSDESGTVNIIGKVDRVDIAAIENKTFFRIIDYKSGKKEFRLSDTFYGLNMQMLIYLLAIWQNGGKKYGEGLTPAGLLYYKAASPYISVERSDSEEEKTDKLQKETSMNGMVVDDSRVLCLMEEGGKGIYVPAKFKRDGSISGNCISFPALDKLKEKADNLILDMAKLLREGRIEALPVSGANYKSICDYCDYKAVCGYERDIPVKNLTDMKHGEALEFLEKGDEDSEQTGLDT